MNLRLLRQRLFTIVSTISLLLCLVMVALSLRSHWYVDDYLFSISAVAQVNVSIYPGELIFRVGHLVMEPRGIVWLHSGEPAGTGVLNLPLFGTAHSSNLEMVWFPIWLPAILFAIAPACWLSPHRRRANRRRLGLCLHCGYDLRGSPQGGRCPECGAEKA